MQLKRFCLCLPEQAADTFVTLEAFDCPASCVNLKRFFKRQRGICRRESQEIIDCSTRLKILFKQRLNNFFVGSEILMTQSC